MFCFGNAMFESCSPILVVYLVFVLCILLIVIVLFRCICSSFTDSKDYVENDSEEIPPSVVHIHPLNGDEQILVEKDKIPGGTAKQKSEEIASKILLQQKEIYQMANYNKIEPSYI